MKKYTLEEMESCIYENKENLKNPLRRLSKVNILNYTQIDDRFIVVETDDKIFNDCFFKTLDMESNDTIWQVSNNIDKQILITLWYKYDWSNSQFSQFAIKMLSI